jgi:glutamate-1-semialdehyde 2,1-aminomutase
MCRQVTRRPKVAVVNWCYHGSVDEAFVTLEGSRQGNVGPMVDPAETTRVAEFNELDSVEAALAHGAVACLLMDRRSRTSASCGRRTASSTGCASSAPGTARC